MSKIVRQHYPAAKLPDDLREGLDPDMAVTVTVEQGRPRPTIAEILGSRRPPYRSADEIDSDLRRLREEWDQRG